MIDKHSIAVGDGEAGPKIGAKKYFFGQISNDDR